MLNISHTYHAYLCPLFQPISPGIFDPFGPGKHFSCPQIRYHLILSCACCTQVSSGTMIGCYLVLYRKGICPYSSFSSFHPDNVLWFHDSQVILSLQSSQPQCPVAFHFVMGHCVTFSVSCFGYLSSSWRLVSGQSSASVGCLYLTAECICSMSTNCDGSRVLIDGVDGG